MKSEIVKTARLRKDIYDALRRVNELSSTRERSLAVDKLQEGIMWLGMHLKAINNLDPYPKSKDPKSGDYVEPTADKNFTKLQ